MSEYSDNLGVNSMAHKFKIGDRVRVIKIDNNKKYGTARYKIGDIGTIIECESTHTYGNYYSIEFDRLKQAGVRYNWYALEQWIQPVENTLMTVE